MNALVYEYAMRKRLTLLGYTSNISELSAEKADAFIEIDLKLQQIMAEKMSSKKG